MTIPLTFTTSAQLNHEQIEKKIAKSEKLSKVSTANVKTRQKRTVSQAGYVSGIPDCHCGAASWQS